MELYDRTVRDAVVLVFTKGCLSPKRIPIQQCDVPQE